MPSTGADPSNHGSPVGERQDTRPNGQQDSGQFDGLEVETKEPLRVQRIQRFLRKAESKRHRLHSDSCPMDQANILSRVFYFWMTPVFYKAWKGTLVKEDLFNCSPYDSAKKNCERLEHLWQKELESRGAEKASLARVYCRFLAKRSLLSCLLVFIALMINCFSSAVLVRMLLQYCQQETSDLGYGLTLAGLMVLCQLFLILVINCSWYMNIRIGGGLRAATICLIYHKTIRLRTTRGLSIGEIVNLCANDGQRMFDMLLHLPHALAGPLLATVALIYTVYLIGPAALLGTGVFIVFYPLQGVFSKIVAHYRQRSIVLTDHRVRLMTEIINCIKLIKMYAWEDSFEASITDIRHKEQRWLVKAGFFQSICHSVTTFVPILSTILTLSLHTLLGHNITAAQAFPYIAVLNAIRYMIIATPLAIKAMTETFVAFHRLKSLLLMDELEEFQDKPEDPNLALSLKGATFAWDKEEPTCTPEAPKEGVGDSSEGQEKGGTGGGDRASKPRDTEPLVDREAAVTKILFDVNLDVQKGQLLGICGSIGSGKSSLLLSILSRMILVDGHVTIDGSFAYVSQQACIMNVTLRENVLMGAELQQGQYDQAIRVCALLDDLDVLPDGDETEIGEQGINISGGQKQRVSLARAVYSDKDIYLLDDPLSAVDAHVGKHIFSQCIEGALNGKTILFVTHQLQYLKRCDRIILMKDGRILEDGTHKELMDNGNEYCNLIKTFHNEDTDEDIEDESGSDDANSVTNVGDAGLQTNPDTTLEELVDAEKPLQEADNHALGDGSTNADVEAERSSLPSIDQDDKEKTNDASPILQIWISKVDNTDQSSADYQDSPLVETNLDKSSNLDRAIEDDSEHSHQVTASSPSNHDDAVARKDSRIPVILISETEDANQNPEETEYGNHPLEPNTDNTSNLEDETEQLQEATTNIPSNRKDVVAKEETADPDSDCSDEGIDFGEGDKFVRTEVSPVKNKLALPFDYLRMLSTDSGSLGGGVDSEETIFYSGKLMEEEESGDRGVTMGTINRYVQSAGGLLATIAVFLCYALSIGFMVFSSWWLSFWLNAGSGNTTIVVDNVTVISDSITDNPQLHVYQLVYGLSAVGVLAVIAFRCFVFAKMTVGASSNLHKKVFKQVVLSPMSFFDTTPLGRILNRFSKDLDELDISLPHAINPFINNSFLVLFSLLTITIIFPYLLVGLLVVFSIFSLLNFFFRHGIRELKRFDNLARSPWFSHITTTVQSLPTIHAYGKQQEFIQRFRNQLDESTNMLILFYLANRWLAIRFDFITVILTASTALLVVLTHGLIPAATAGLAITYANQLVGISQYTVRLSAEVNARFISVERINYYIENLKQEAPRTIKSTKPPPSWPSEGRITVRNLKMRYRPNLPLVLRGLSFEIKPREKVGIVGRTGSGKSSLGVALYRLVEKAYGSITIDGIDISQIGLYDLRSKLSIIPQDPVLFIGTIRYNLDPTSQFSDEEVWKALEKTYMKETISSLDQQLEAPVVENGENFSVGERQLLCMARALLRNSKILILDEATAAIDTETDSLIQQTIRQAFTDCTILTIAHRLNTILDSDRILVLSDGRLVEFDSPSNLLANPSSYFSAMMAAMGDKPH